LVTVLKWFAFTGTVRQTHKVTSNSVNIHRIISIISRTKKYKCECIKVPSTVVNIVHFAILQR